jgi:hypothetical protein
MNNQLTSTKSLIDVGSMLCRRIAKWPLAEKPWKILLFILWSKPKKHLALFSSHVFRFILIYCILSFMLIYLSAKRQRTPERLGVFNGSIPKYWHCGSTHIYEVIDLDDGSLAHSTDGPAVKFSYRTPKWCHTVTVSVLIILCHNPTSTKHMWAGERMWPYPLRRYVPVP